MKINRKKHPILTLDDFQNFVSKLTELEREQLIISLNQTVIDKKVVLEINKKIKSIESNTDKARDQSYASYQDAASKNMDDARNKSLGVYFKTGDILDDITAMKALMNNFE